MKDNKFRDKERYKWKEVGQRVPQALAPGKIADCSPLFDRLLYAAGEVTFWGKSMQHCIKKMQDGGGGNTISIILKADQRPTACTAVYTLTSRL